jgi:hypothetical protein
MNKKGQFYLIMVFILALVIYGITYKTNTIKTTPTFEDFYDISQNYITEAKKITNNAIENEQNPLGNLDTFTNSFLTYAQTRDPNLELLYIYSDGTNIVLSNYMDNPVNSTLGTIPGAGQEAVQEITINVTGKTYTYQVPVALKKFGQNWYMGGVTNYIDIGGITHKLNLPNNAQEIKIIIKTDSNEYTVVCQTGSCQQQ